MLVNQRTIPAVACAAAILAAAVLWRCGPAEPRFAGAPVIFISIDTLRSDRLPAYGYQGLETPAFDAFFNDAVLFENAYAQVPITLPSHASVFTGLTPPRHGVRENVGYKLGEDHKTLAEALGQAGFRTGGFVSSMVLRRSTGVAQGFQTYDDELAPPVAQQNVASYQDRSGADTLARAQTWLEDGQNAPPFLFVHLYEPHTPYEPPSPFRERVQHPYDGEIAYVDSLLGGFFEWLKSRGLYDQALIFVFSDHGEGLGDHGELEHGLFVYREAIQVPLAVKLPGSAQAGRREARPAGLIDLKATVLALLGLPPVETEGVSLFSGQLRKDRDIYSEAMTAELNYGWHASRSVVRNRLHYIEGFQPELFDLAEDPGETVNLYGKRGVPPSAVATIESMRGSQGLTQEISQEERELLASLGYTGSFEMGDSAKSLTPQAFLRIYGQFGAVRALINEKKYPEAESQLTELLQKYPDLVEFRVMLGHTLNLQQKYALSEHVHAEGLATAPHHDGLLDGMVAALLGSGKIEQARVLADKCMERSPELAGRKMTLLFFEAGDYEGAKKYANMMRARAPKLAFAYSVLGEVAGRPEDVDRLRSLLRRTLADFGPEIAASLSDALLFLGDSLARLDRELEATLVLKACLERDPGHAGSRAALSKLYASRRMTRESLATLDDWVSRFPTRENYLIAAETMAQIGIEDAARFYREKADQYPPDKR